MWMIHCHEPGREVRTFRLMPGTIKTLGRAKRADFVLDAAFVSRLHCRFSVSGEGMLSVEDLGSTNGTFVNDKRVERTQLAAGDRVRVGRVELTFSPEESRNGLAAGV